MGSGKNKVSRTSAESMRNWNGPLRAGKCGERKPAWKAVPTEPVQDNYNNSMKPCISQATTLPRSFAEDVADFASAGCEAMEVWLTKLEQHLESHSAADTRKLVQDRGITLAGASYQGGLLLSQGQQRKAHFDH